VKRNFSALQAIDARRVDVDAGNVVTEVGEPGAGDEADVSRADDGELHGGHYLHAAPRPQLTNRRE